MDIVKDLESNPRIVFFGTTDFAVASLDGLLKAGFTVIAVITTPDKRSGRGLQLSSSPVKRYALAHDLDVLQPDNLKSETFFNALNELRPDLQVVVAFRMLPQSIWALPPMGTLNLHASLLPQYRGAAPINWVLINGESETGVTTFLIDEQLDTGAILMQETLSIDADETAGQLTLRLKTIGAALVENSVRQLWKGKVIPISQEHFFVDSPLLKSAPKLSKEDRVIDWSETVDNVYNRIRAFEPNPGASTSIWLNNGEELPVKIIDARKILAEAADVVLKPGGLKTDKKKYLYISANGGWIDIRILQPAGRNAMTVVDFLNGFGLKLP